MSDPSSFVNFSDYLGLNEGVGDAMRQRLEANYKGPSENDIRRYSDQEVAGAENGDLSAYQTNKDAVRTGTATYADFLGGMADPAKRQALLEKAYGAANQWDSALAGNGHDQREADAKLSGLSNYTDQRGLAADATADSVKGSNAYIAAKSEQDRQTSRRHGDEAAAAAKAKQDEDYKQRVLEWAKTNHQASGGFDGYNTSGDYAFASSQENNPGYASWYADAAKNYDADANNHKGKTYRQGGVDAYGHEQGIGWY